MSEKLRVDNTYVLVKVHRRNSATKEIVNEKLFGKIALDTPPVVEGIDPDYWKLEYVSLKDWFEYIHDSAYDEGVQDG